MKCLRQWTISPAYKPAYDDADIYGKEDPYFCSQKTKELWVELANELKHCVIAHHGELEYGSPKNAGSGRGDGASLRRLHRRKNCRH